DQRQRGREEHVDERDHERVVQAGVGDHLPDVVQSDELRRRQQTVIGERQAQRGDHRQQRDAQESQQPGRHEHQPGLVVGVLLLRAASLAARGHLYKFSDSTHAVSPSSGPGRRGRGKGVLPRPRRRSGTCCSAQLRAASRSSTRRCPASSGVMRPKSMSSPARVRMSSNSPPPCGVISGGGPSSSSMASAASGSWALAEIDQYMEALYHSWASAAEPVIEGGRSTVMPPGTAASWATTWLDQATVMPMRSVANRDWSSDWAASSTEVEASGPAPVSSMRWAYSIREVAASASKPTPPSRYWSCPSCRIHTWNNAWIVAIWVMP